MTFAAASAFPLALLALAVVLPLGREYAAFRREWGLGRAAALGTALSLVPALGVGLAVSQPLAGVPAAQWTLAVVVAFLAYSLAVALVRPRAPLAAARPRRRR